MTAARTPPPQGLQARGQAFWHTIMDSYELGPDETELLVEVVRCLDQAEALERILQTDGLIARGAAGQPRAHPAVAALQATRSLTGRLMAQLQLPDEDGATLDSARRAQTRRAARARWQPTDNIRALRRHGAPPAT